jgi:hypothetical protein
VSYLSANSTLMVATASLDLRSRPPQALQGVRVLSGSKSTPPCLPPRGLQWRCINSILSTPFTTTQQEHCWTEPSMSTERAGRANNRARAPVPFLKSFVSMPFYVSLLNLY